MIACEIIKPREISPEDEAAWRQMCQSDYQLMSPILSPEFAKLIDKVRDDAFVAIFRENQAPIGFLGFHRRPNNFARPLGAPFSDYSALITGPNPKIKIAQALELAGIRQYQAIGLVDPHNVCGDVFGDEEDAYGICLRSELPMNTLSRKHRKNARRLHRHLEADVGEAKFIFDDKSNEHYDKMIALKRRQIKETGIHDFLAPDWVVKMMNELRSADRNGIHGCLITMLAGDTPVSFQFGVKLGPRAHAWIATFDPKYSQYSPGQLFLTEVPDTLIANGMDYYDLATGHQYKNNLTNNGFKVRHASLYSTTNENAKNGASADSGKIGQIKQKLRRRFDQIAALEITTSGRVKGVINAFANAGKRIKFEPTKANAETSSDNVQESDE